MAAGGAPAGIYTTCSPSEVQYIVHHCEAPFVLVENLDQYEKIRKERARLPQLGGVDISPLLLLLVIQACMILVGAIQRYMIDGGAYF